MESTIGGKPEGGVSHKTNTRSFPKLEKRGFFEEEKKEEKNVSLSNHRLN